MSSRVASCLVVALLLSLPIACGSSQTASQAELTKRADQRLNGGWMLTSFTPDQDFEPAVASLVQAQFGTLRIDVANGQFTATGTALSTARRYRILGVQGERVSLVIEEPSGVGYDVLAEFRGNELYFDSQTTPWRGRGTLKRVP